MPLQNLRDKLDQKIFDAIYSRSLVYNTCWEDPAVDRKALALGPDDTVLVITSAGCNALDYALEAPKRIHAVDANPPFQYSSSNFKTSRNEDNRLSKSSRFDS